MTAENPPLEFWRLKQVCAATGLSRSEIYRRVAEGRFPAGRKYSGSSIIFWPSNVVRHWMMAELGDSFEDLLG